MKTSGIERQTLLLTLIPILLMTITLQSYFIVARFNDLDDSLLQYAKMMTHQFVTSSEYAVFSGNSTLLQQYIDDALSQQNVNQLLVLGKDDKPLLGYAKNPAMLLKVNQSKPIFQDDLVLMIYKPIYPTQIKLEELDFQPRIQPVAQLGAVIIEFSKISLSKQKHEILIFSLTITFLIFFTTLLLALWGARRITLPILSMSQTLHRFGQGNLQVRVSTDSTVLELNELATGFNQMAWQLQQNQEKLESRVADRTAALADSEQEYRTLIENTPDTIARYDRDCRRIYVNQAFAAMTEGGREALLGMKPSEFPGGFH